MVIIRGDDDRTTDDDHMVKNVLVFKTLVTDISYLNKHLSLHLIAFALALVL